MTEIKPTSFRISEEARRLLRELAKSTHRKDAQMLEVLIFEAAKKAKLK